MEMKNRDMACSATRSEPSHCQVVLVDATRPIVPPGLWRMSRRPLTCPSKGGSMMSEALMAQLRVRTSSSWSHMRVFNTSNVVHFGTALLIAALLSAPWSALWTAALLLGLAGLGGVRYVLIVLWEVRHRLVGYQLVRSDWLWYTLLPLISYTALVVAAILLPIYPGPVLFIIAAVTMLLLFTGIHNAWDVVTYMAIEHSQPQDPSQD